MPKASWLLIKYWRDLYLRSKINNFKIDFEGAKFEFITMHNIKLSYSKSMQDMEDRRYDSIRHAMMKTSFI